MLWQIDPKDVNVMVNFCKTAQRPSSPMRMLREDIPRSALALVPHVRSTSFDSGSLQNGCPCNALSFHPNGLHKLGCQCHR